MNRKLYCFLKRRLSNERSQVRFAKSLNVDDIADFIFETYGVYVYNVKFDAIQKEKIVFRFYGNYLHCGVNNISFTGVFEAKDFEYKIITSVSILDIKHTVSWRDFMCKRFGRRYKKALNEIVNSKTNG